MCHPKNVPTWNLIKFCILFCVVYIYNDQETYDHRKIVLDLVELHTVFSNENLHVPCDTRWGRKEPWCFWCRFHPLMATGKGFPKKYYDVFLGWEEMEDSQLGKDVYITNAHSFANWYAVVKSEFTFLITACCNWAKVQIDWGVYKQSHN